MSKAFAIVLSLALLTITSCELAKPVKLASSFPPQTQYDVFPDSASPGATPRFQAARTPDGTLLGYRIDTQSRCRSGSFPLRLETGPNGTIRKIIVPSYPHRRGRGVTRESFLRQFNGKPIRTLNPAEIDTVSGATSSCRGLIRAIRQSAKKLPAENP